jgi:hypothetical protein
MPGGKLGDIVEQAQELQRMYGGGQAWQPGAPDPGSAAAAPTPPAGPSGGPAIVAHRLFPEIRQHNSTRQLDHFLPSYRETVGVRSDDVYGVFPWTTRTSSSGAQQTSSTEWDDYWIVYRDRPEYASGREAYERQMDDQGRWPEAVVAPGVGEASGQGSELGEVEVEKVGWPRKALVIKLTGTGLADSIRERMSTWGYEPEDSFGFCPNFEHRNIYFAWRKT